MPYLGEPPSDRTAFRMRGGLIHALRTRDIDLSVDHPNEVGITVELNDQFTVRRRSGGRTTHQAGAAGGVVVDLPGHQLDLSIRGECRIVQLALPLVLLREIAEEDLEHEGNPLDLRPSSGEQDTTMLHLICRAAVQTEAEAEMELLRSLVSHLLNHYSARNPARVRSSQAGISPTRLHRVRELVEENLAAVTVAQMAAMTGLSPFHFAREFKRSTGRTPWEYVTSRRLARAVDRLADRSAPLSQVALAAGFASANHLNHRMRACMGVSPTAMRTTLLV